MQDLLVKYKVLLIQLGLVAFVLGTVYSVAVIRTKAECKVEQATAKIEGVKQNEAIKQKVTSLSDADLDKRLSRWVRD